MLAICLLCMLVVMEHTAALCWWQDRILAQLKHELQDLWYKCDVRWKWINFAVLSSVGKWHFSKYILEWDTNSVGGVFTPFCVIISENVRQNKCLVHKMWFIFLLTVVCNIFPSENCFESYSPDVYRSEKMSFVTQNNPCATVSPLILQCVPRLRWSCSIQVRIHKCLLPVCLRNSQPVSKLAHRNEVW
jgi:hypothetical protein